MPSQVQTVVAQDQNDVTTHLFSLPRDVVITFICAVLETGSLGPVHVTLVYLDDRINTKMKLDGGWLRWGGLVSNTHSLTLMGGMLTPDDQQGSVQVQIYNKTGNTNNIKFVVIYTKEKFGLGVLSRIAGEKLFLGATWIFRAVFTQAGAGGGIVVVDISPDQGQEMMLMYATTGKDDYAANKVIDGFIVDLETSNKNYAAIVNEGGIDNEQLFLPEIPTATYAPDTIVPLNSQLQRIISGNHALRLRTSSLVQNETFTIIVVCRIDGDIPSFVTTASGGTVGAPTVTYNKVI